MIRSAQSAAEIDLVTLCARTEPSETVTTRVRSLVATQLDWNLVVEVADRQRVVPLLLQSLKRIAPESADVQAMSRLDDRCRAIVAGNLLLTGELVRLLNLLPAGGVDVIPFKGPLLAAVAYGDLALRQFGDIDVLVPAESFHNAETRLIEDGYERVLHLGWESHFVHQQRGVAVDLHGSVLPPAMPFRLDFRRLQKRLRSVSLAGTVIDGISAEDTLLIACAQLTKDASESKVRLQQICDIAQLLRRNAAMNWDEVVRHADVLGSTRMLSLGLRLAHQLLEAPVPDPILAALPADHVLEGLTAEIQQQLGARSLGISPPHASYLDRARFHRRARERIRDQCYPYFHRYIASIVRTGGGEQALLPLPNRLRFFHRLLRPPRLLARLVTGKSGGNR